MLHDKHLFASQDFSSLGGYELWTQPKYTHCFTEEDFTHSKLLYDLGSLGMTPEECVFLGFFSTQHTEGKLALLQVPNFQKIPLEHQEHFL